MDDGSAYGWIEIVLTFGGLLAFCGWQWWDMRRLAAAREKTSREASPGPGKSDPPS